MPPNPRLIRLGCLVATVSMVVATSPARAAEPAWRWPTSNGQLSLIRPFQAPLGRYGSGHRGVDLKVNIGQQIRAPAPGTVSFNAQVAQVPTLVIDHGSGLRSTYQPVASALKVGARVRTGDVIGVIVAAEGHCPLATCLHWGVRNLTGYLDPIKLIRRSSPVLLPLIN